MAWGQLPNWRKVGSSIYGPKPAAKPSAWGNSGGMHISTTPAAAPAAAPAPAVVPDAGGGGTPPAPPKTPDPRDSQFTTDTAGLLFRNKNARDDLNKQGAQAGEDFNTMLSRMAENRAKDLVATSENANREGLFYSGQLGKRQGDVETGYKQREGDARTSFDRSAEARAAALERLGTISADPDPNSLTGLVGTGQAGLDLRQFLTDAVGRRIVANPGAGDAAAASGMPDTPAAGPAPLAAGAPQVASSGPQPTNSGSQPAIKIAASAKHGGAKWVYHRAANGQWIPIRPA